VTSSAGTKRFTYRLRAHKAPKEAVK
jgi:hypothetical protein